MSEMTWCSVDIKLPAHWLADDDVAAAWPDWLAETFAGDVTDWGDQDDSAAIFTLQGEWNYGMTDDNELGVLSQWCTLHRIPCTIVEEGGPDWTGSRQVYDGTEWVHTEATNQGDPVLTLAKLKDLATFAAAVAYLERREQSICDLSVEHLANAPAPSLGTLRNPENLADRWGYEGEEVLSTDERELLTLAVMGWFVTTRQIAEQGNDLSHYTASHTVGATLRVAAAWPEVVVEAATRLGVAP